MSWRTDQPFGSLVDTVAQAGSAQPRTPWCLIDGRHPGVIAAWTNHSGVWTALVC